MKAIIYQSEKKQENNFCDNLRYLWFNRLPSGHRVNKPQHEYTIFHMH